MRFGENPHKAGTEVFEKFEKAKGAKTVGEAKELGASAWELGEWFKKGRLKVEMEITGGDTAVDVDSQEDASVKAKVTKLESTKRLLQTPPREPPVKKERLGEPEPAFPSVATFPSVAQTGMVIDEDKGTEPTTTDLMAKLNQMMGSMVLKEDFDNHL